MRSALALFPSSRACKKTDLRVLAQRPLIITLTLRFQLIIGSNLYLTKIGSEYLENEEKKTNCWHLESVQGIKLGHEFLELTDPLKASYFLVIVACSHGTTK